MSDENRLSELCSEAEKAYLLARLKENEGDPWECVKHPSYSLNSFEQVAKTIAKWSK